MSINANFDSKVEDDDSTVAVKRDMNYNRSNDELDVKVGVILADD